MPTLGKTLPLLAALLAATACGTATGDRSTDAGPHGCTASAVRHGQAVGAADLDGDDHLERVYYASSGWCRGLATATPTGVIGTDLKGLDVDPATIRMVQTRGPDPQVLVLVGERAHAREGRQWHLFGPDGGTISEVTVGGHPVLPFYATDGGGQPTTATCPSAGGVAVVTATTHEPPGIVLAWDVHRTTYRVDGSEAAVEHRSTVATAAADPTLRKRMPHLFDGTLLTGCEPRAAG